MPFFSNLITLMWVGSLEVIMINIEIERLEQCHSAAQQQRHTTKCVFVCLSWALHLPRDSSITLPPLSTAPLQSSVSIKLGVGRVLYKHPAEGSYTAHMSLIQMDWCTGLKINLFLQTQRCTLKSPPASKHRWYTRSQFPTLFTPLSTSKRRLWP